jgi:hypothetical protein
VKDRAALFLIEDAEKRGVCAPMCAPMCVCVLGALGGPAVFAADGLPCLCEVVSGPLPTLPPCFFTLLGAPALQCCA